MNSGIITAIPRDRFGACTVTFDGSGVVETVPVNKLSWRWTKTYSWEDECWYHVNKIDGSRLQYKPKVYTEVHDRLAEIQKRKIQYKVKSAQDDEKRLLKSAIKLQCAWRAKKAREKFKETIKLRAREQERALLVEKTAAKARKRRPFAFFRRR